MKKRRNILLIVILVLIINIVLFVILLNYKNELNYSNENEPEIGQLVNDTGETYSVVLNNKLFPANYIAFEKQYTGKVNLDNVYLRLNTVIKYVKTISNSDELKNEESIIQYYNNNFAYIKSATTIKNASDFKKLVDKVMNIQDAIKANRENVSFDMETYTLKNSVMTCEIKVKYSENEYLKFILKTNEDNKDFILVF